MHDERSYDHRTSDIERHLLADAQSVVSTVDSQAEVGCSNKITGSATNAMFEKSKPPTLRSLLVHRTVIIIINYALLAFSEQCLGILLPLMYSTSLTLGGFGFSSSTIGIVLGMWGVVNGMFNIFAFPRLLRRFGFKRLFVVSAVSSLLCSAVFPVMSYLAKHSESVDAKIWIILIIQLALYVLAYMGFGEPQCHNRVDVILI